MVVEALHVFPDAAACPNVLMHALRLATMAALHDASESSEDAHDAD